MITSKNRIFTLLVLCLLGIYNLSYATTTVQRFAEIHISIEDNHNERTNLIEKQLLTGDERVLYSGNINRIAETIRIPCDNPSIIYLTHKNISFPIYIDKNAELFINIPADPVLDIKFTGTNASINNYLFAKKNKLDVLISKDLKLNYALTAQEFEALNQRIEIEIAELRNKYLLNNADKRFKMFDKADIVSLLTIRKLLYSDYHYYFTKERVASLHDYKELPRIISFENEYGLLSKHYTDLLSMYIDNLVRRDTVSSKSGTDKTQSDPLEKVLNCNNLEFKNRKVAEYFNTKLLLLAIDLGRNSFAEEKLKVYNRILKDPNPTYLKTVNQKLIAIEKIGSGKEALDFEMKDVQGKRMSLKSFKGKALYINVWSPACSPSIDELENINEIFNQFKDDDRIAFLNVCLDTELNELIFNSNVQSIRGNHLIPTDAKDFVQSYFINVTPRYILIDKDGKIFNPFAKRPSDSMLVQEIKDVLSVL